MTDLSGRLVVVKYDVAATGVENLHGYLKPTNGKVWKVMYAYGFHISGGNRTVTWYAADGTNTMEMYSNSAVGDSAKIHAGLVTTTQWYDIKDMLLTITRYLDFVVAATGAGDHLYLRAIVMEYAGQSEDY